MYVHYKGQEAKVSASVREVVIQRATREVTQINLENKNKIRNFYDSQLEKDSK